MLRAPAVRLIAVLILALVAAPPSRAQQLTAAVAASAYEALGQARLDVVQDEAGRTRLHVSNVGDAGRDGLVLRPAAGRLPAVALAAADLQEAELTVHVFAEDPSAGRVGFARLESRGADLGFSVRFPETVDERVVVFDGANREQKMIRGGELILIDEPGSEIVLQHWGDPHERLDGKHVDDWEAAFALRFGQRTRVSMPDGSHLEGDAVAVEAVEPLAVGAIARIEIRVSGVDAITFEVPGDAPVQGLRVTEAVRAVQQGADPSPSALAFVADAPDARPRLHRHLRQRRDGRVLIHAADGGPRFFADLRGGRVVGYAAVGADGEPLDLSTVTDGEEDTVCWVCGNDEDGTTHCVQIECPVIVSAPGGEE